MIVVDSSVWISHFANIEHPEVKVLRNLDEPEQVLVGDLILLEVLKGARSEGSAYQIESEMAEFDRANMIDADLARVAAANYRRLRTLSITIRSSIDLIIGTYCIEHGHSLLHRDRDFHYMEQLGLKTYTP